MLVVLFVSLRVLPLGKAVYVSAGVSVRLAFASDCVVDFLAMDGDVCGGGDSESHFFAANVNDGDFDIITDDDGFVALSGEYQDEAPLFLGLGVLAGLGLCVWPV